LARIRTSTSRGALKDCDLVVEAVPETMAIKTPVYQVRHHGGALPFDDFFKQARR
jgi:3-hydroxyacyl-CoA dehydrogenase